MIKKSFSLFLILCLALVPAAVLALGSDGAVQIYTGVLIRDLLLRPEMNKDAAGSAQLVKGEKVYIYDYTPQWLHIRTKADQEGYVLRQYVDQITPVDPANTLPYGAVVHHQVATVNANTSVFKQKDEGSDAYCILTPGSRISVWYIKDGWATVPYQREIGYVHASKLKELTPVSPTVDYARPGQLLAAFTSFYSMATNELNQGRMVNIQVACDYISKVLEPGETFSFNNVAGPYRRQRGYMPAPVLIDGTTMPGYGGGTCQVSSTLYNVLLQLPQGMQIVYRRPHGPGGAKYLPHGVDAAVGSDALDLVFKNVFAFPVLIDAQAQDGALYIAMYKQ